MTTAAGGNVALAVFFSAGTNILAVVTVPFFLAAIFSGSDTGAAASAFNPLDLLWKLTLSIRASAASYRVVEGRLGLPAATATLRPPPTRGIGQSLAVIRIPNGHEARAEGQQQAV